MRTSLLLLVFASCGRRTCGDGTMQVENVCVAIRDDDTDVAYVPPPSFEEVFDGFPACVPSEGDGRIDLDQGCADDACADMTKLEIDGALGDTGDCYSNYYDPTLVYCSWADGIGASFDDLDEDGDADPESVAGYLYLDPPFEGATTTGLGLGTNWACFFDTLGPADYVTLWHDGDEYSLSYVGWFDRGLSASDYWGDGEVTGLSISGR